MNRLTVNRIVDNGDYMAHYQSGMVQGTAPIQHHVAEDATLDAVFFALADPIRRAILNRLDQAPALVSELAAPFAVSLEAGPILAAAVWVNRYSKYWQAQFDLLALTLEGLDRQPKQKPTRRDKEAK